MCKRVVDLIITIYHIVLVLYVYTKNHGILLCIRSQTNSLRMTKLSNFVTGLTHCSSPSVFHSVSLFLPHTHTSLTAACLPYESTVDLKLSLPSLFKQQLRQGNAQMSSSQGDNETVKNALLSKFHSELKTCFKKVNFL